MKQIPEICSHMLTDETVIQLIGQLINNSFANQLIVLVI